MFKEEDFMTKDSENEIPDSTMMKKRMTTHNPDHHHRTILKLKIQKRKNLSLMLKTKTSLKLLELFQNTIG